MAIPGLVASARIRGSLCALVHLGRTYLLKERGLISSGDVGCQSFLASDCIPKTGLQEERTGCNGLISYIYLFPPCDDKIF